MEITDVRVKLLTKENSNVKASANVTIDNALAIHGIFIYEDSNGQLHMSMPARKADDKFVDIVHPINAEVRSSLQEKIFTAYKAIAI